MKYIEAAKTIFKAQFAYRFDIALNMIYTVAKILLAYILWSAIFEGKELVAGFTFDAMLTYYVIHSFLAQLDMSAGTGSEIAARILNGTFSARMVQPVNLFGFYAAQTAGAAVFHLGYNLCAVVAWTALFRVPMALTGNAMLIAGALLMFFMGLLFMVQLNYLIGIMAFKFHEVWMFQMIKDGIVLLATGGLIPLALLPGALISVMKCFPFYYISYLPALLLMGRNEGELGMGLMVISMWCAAFAIVNRIVFARLRTLYDGVGI